MYRFIYISLLLLFFCTGCPNKHRLDPKQQRISTKKMSAELSQKIQEDVRIQEVMARAEKLIGTGLNAGDGYSEVWIRDLNTFIETACKVSSQDKIRESLLTFFKFQQEDGEILDGYTLKKNTGGGVFYYSDLAPDFAGHKNTVETDQETSLIQAISKYIKATGDVDFLKVVVDNKTVAHRMEEALHFLLNKRFSDKYGLIWGATTVDWGDVSPEKGGIVRMTDTTKTAIDIYDNAMFLIAIDDYVRLLTEPSKINFWNEKREQIASNAMKYLWDEKNKKFIPHIYLHGSPFSESFDENAIYYHGGTGIAIEAGLLSKKQILEAYQRMQKNVLDAHAQTIGLTVYPVYPESEWKFNVMKPYHYQNGGDWTWFGARMVQELIVNGFYEEAYEAISPMLDRVIEHNGFYEWWTPDGQPKGSSSFRGSAGVLWKAIVMFQERV